MATKDEENAWGVFLQALAVALSNFLGQAPPQDRTIENFQRVLDGCLGQILDDPTANSPLVRGNAQRLKSILYREIERMPLHRMRDDTKH